MVVDVEVLVVVPVSVVVDIDVSVMVDMPVSVVVDSELIEVSVVVVAVSLFPQAASDIIAATAAVAKSVFNMGITPH